MIEQGYKFSNHGVCREAICKADIEWWTTAAGKKAPYDLMPDGNSRPTSHFVTCPAADSFRRGR
jgi:hypothetical protein